MSRICLAVSLLSLLGAQCSVASDGGAKPAPVARQDLPNAEAFARAKAIVARYAGEDRHARRIEKVISQVKATNPRARSVPKDVPLDVSGKVKAETASPLHLRSADKPRVEVLLHASSHVSPTTIDRVAILFWHEFARTDKFSLEDHSDTWRKNANVYFERGLQNPDGVDRSYGCGCGVDKPRPGTYVALVFVAAFPLDGGTATILDADMLEIVVDR